MPKLLLILLLGVSGCGDDGANAFGEPLIQVPDSELWSVFDDSGYDKRIRKQAVIVWSPKATVEEADEGDLLATVAFVFDNTEENLWLYFSMYPETGDPLGSALVIPWKQIKSAWWVCYDKPLTPEVG